MMMEEQNEMKRKLDITPTLQQRTCHSYRNFTTVDRIRQQLPEPAERESPVHLRLHSL